MAHRMSRTFEIIVTPFSVKARPNRRVLEVFAAVKVCEHFVFLFMIEKKQKIFIIADGTDSLKLPS